MGLSMGFALSLVGMGSETLFLYVVCQLFYTTPNALRARYIFLLAISS